MVVDQLVPPPITWAPVRTTEDTPLIRVASFLILSTSAKVKRLKEPAPIRAPPLLVLPGKTIIRLVPRALILLSI